MSDIFAEELAELQKHAEIVKAWQAFLCPRNRELLASCKAEGAYNGGGEGGYRSYLFDNGHINLRDTTERDARKVINAMLLPGVESRYHFIRPDIYNKTAWAKMPLACFVPCKHSEWVCFGIDQPMVFAVSSFRLEAHIRHSKSSRWARLYCVDARLDQKTYRGKRWVAEHDYPRDEAPAKDVMFRELLDQVEENGPEHLFTITKDSFLGAVIAANAKQGVLL